VVEPTHLKNMLVILDHFPKDWGENKKYLSCHQPDELGSMVAFSGIWSPDILGRGYIK